MYIGLVTIDWATLPAMTHAVKNTVQCRLFTELQLLAGATSAPWDWWLNEAAVGGWVAHASLEGIWMPAAQLAADLHNRLWCSFPGACGCAYAKIVGTESLIWNSYNTEKQL